MSFRLQTSSRTIAPAFNPNCPRSAPEPYPARNRVVDITIGGQNVTSSFTIPKNTLIYSLDDESFQAFTSADTTISTTGASVDISLPVYLISGERTFSVGIPERVSGTWSGIGGNGIIEGAVTAVTENTRFLQEVCAILVKHNLIAMATEDST